LLCFLLLLLLLLLQAAGLPAGGGREVLLSWLAGVAAANEIRCKGGEYSALQHLLGEWVYYGHFYCYNLCYFAYWLPQLLIGCSRLAG
jgi:hypothetical protein